MQRIVHVMAVSALFVVFLSATNAQDPAGAGTTSQIPEWGYLKIKPTGGLIHGKLISKDYKASESDKPSFIVETENGGRLQILRSAASWQAEDDPNLEYKRILPQMSDTVDDHWKMVEWCQEKSTSKLKEQIEYHLLQVVSKDPQHEMARKELGKLKWVEANGRWLPEAQYYALFGYELKGNRPIPVAQQFVNDIQEQQQAKIDAQKKVISNWQNQFNQGRFANGNEATHSLKQAVTELAIPELDARAKQEDNWQVRAVFLDVISEMPSPGAQVSMIRFLLEDPDQRLREKALSVLTSPAYDQGEVTRFRAVSVMIGSGALDPTRMTNNEQLQNAAAAIGELGTLNAVLPLIESIVTSHTIKTGNDPNRINAQNGGGAGLSLGGGPAEVTTQITNQKVLNALRSVTGANPGGTPEAWRDWYVKNYSLTHHSASVNRDE